MAEGTEKQQEQEIKKIVQGDINPEEAVKLKNIAEPNKDNLPKVEKIFSKYKDKISDGIVKYLNPEADGSINITSNKIDNLKLEEKQAYQNIISRLGLSKSGEIETRNQLLINAINAQLKKQTIIKKPEAEKQEPIKENQPENLLLQNPSMLKAQINETPQEENTILPPTEGVQSFLQKQAKEKFDKANNSSPKEANTDNQDEQIKPEPTVIKLQNGKIITIPPQEEGVKQDKEGKKKEVKEENKEKIDKGNNGANEDKEKENVTEKKDETVDGKKKLLDVLNVQAPDKELANKLFGGDDAYKVARDALFENNNMSQAIDVKSVQKGSNEEKLVRLIAIGCGLDKTEDIKTIDFHKIGDSQDYPLNNYIKVTLSNGDFRDILFTKKTDENYSKRAETFYVTERDGKKTIKENLTTLDKKGTYRSFEKVIDAKIAGQELKTLLSNQPGLLNEIKSFHGDEKVNDRNTKENGYYNAILDHVVEETKSNRNDLSLLQEYLKQVNANNIGYMGTDIATQTLNYNKLFDLMKDPSFPKDTDTGKEIIKNIGSLFNQLNKPKNGRKEAINDSVSVLFEKFGKQIVSILERFGGKGCVAKFFKSIGLEDFYNKNFQEIQDKIDAAYKDKFDLKKEKVDAINNNIVKDSFTETKIPAVDKENILVTTGRYIDNFKNTKNGNKTNQELFTENIKSDNGKYIGMLDPKLVNYLVTKKFSRADGLKDDGKALTASDFVVKGKDGELQINENLKSDGGNQDKLIARLFADKATWETIKNANIKINGVNVAKKGEKPELSRSDLDQSERTQYSIQSEKDIAKYLAAYAFAGSKDLDYVVSESGLSNGKVDVNNTPQERKLTLKDATDFDDNGLTEKSKNKKIHELIDVTKSPEKLQIVRGATIITIEQKQIGSGLTYSADGGKTRFSILKGDKVQEVPKEKKEVVKITDGKIYNITKDTSLRKEGTTENKTSLTTNDKVTEVLEDGKTVIKKGSDLGITDDNKNKEFIKVKKGEDVGYVPKDGFLTEEAKK